MNSVLKVCMVLVCSFVICALGCSDDNTIAKVNGKKISKAQFEAFLKLKNIPGDDKARLRPVLDDYLEREAMAELVKETAFIDSAITDAELAEFRKQMLISRYFENYLKDKVNDEAVINYYNTNIDEFETEQIKVSHILLRTNPKMSANERKAIQTKAHEIYSKLAAKADFADLAKKFSEDKVSAKNHGSLGWIKRGAIDPTFSKKVFSMQPGEISQPFSTVFGFHIVRIDEDIQTVKAPLEKVKGDIRFRLRSQAKDAEMERLKKQMKIEVCN